MVYRYFTSAVFFTFFIAQLVSCSSRKGEQKDEQLRVTLADTTTGPDSLNSIEGNVSWKQIATTPHSVVLTGLPDHRLVTIYKSRRDGKPAGGNYVYRSSYSSDYYESEFGEGDNHFMPDIDLIYGYNLLNVAHYDLKSEKLSILFDQPVLIKSLYYPCFIQDSLDKKPINRDYYLISVYDEDTNKDTLLNKRDLRRFYHFNAACDIKTRLIPADYSVSRSQYDPKNDVMYIFAYQDANKNGTIEKTEPLHIFWISLQTPAVAKRMY